MFIGRHKHEKMILKVCMRSWNKNKSRQFWGCRYFLTVFEVVYISENIQWDPCNKAKAISLDFYGRLLIGGGGYTISFFSRQFITSIHSMNEKAHFIHKRADEVHGTNFLYFFPKLRIFIYLNFFTFLYLTHFSLMSPF